ncbi:MAG: hypothetical protein ACYCVB_12520 [Bacilli bacterium]
MTDENHFRNAGQHLAKGARNATEAAAEGRLRDSGEAAAEGIADATKELGRSAGEAFRRTTGDQDRER